MATRSMPFWPRPATTSGSSWPGSGLCAPFSGRLSWSGITRAAPLPHPPEHANSLFHRRPDWIYTNRNYVERLWARLKEWRAIATRYEKTASSFMGVLFLAAALDWLKG